MNNIFPRLKREILGVFPIVVFFFIVFQLLAFTKVLILKEYGIEFSAFLNATVAALIVGKVVPITDLLPFINRFPNKPLIYNIVWKSSIYVIAALLVRYAEHLIPLIFEHRDVMTANSNLFGEVVWPHFWLVQIWLFVCFFMYCTVREVGRIIGYEKLRAMIFSHGYADRV